MDDRAIARWRMHVLRLVGRPYGSPAAVVEGLLAVQAENARQASWALAARTSGLTEPELGPLFADGVILRTHVLRPTWHFVRPADIRWLLEVTAPQQRRNLAAFQEELALDDAELERSAQLIADVLSGAVHLTRDALGQRLREAGLHAEGRRLGAILFFAELSGLVCSGIPEGWSHTYALLDERAPGARRLDPAEARVELVLRYFTGHGPATERDLAYWASMSLTHVRAGLVDVGDRLERAEHGGRTYWFAQAPPERLPDGGSTPDEPRGHLLQVLDEYHNGYQDSRYVLDADGIVPRGRAPSVGMALVDGQMVGGMRRTVRARDVVFDVHLHRDLDHDEREALEAAADRYGAFLEREPVLVLSPRKP